MGVFVTMLIIMGAAAAVGILMAKLQLKSDISVLYSTRPLNDEQIALLNVELKKIKKERDEKKK
jgi:hypothetical protein